MGSAMAEIRRSYLDHNATTPLLPAAARAVAAAMSLRGNPSSPHAEGRAARAVIEQARRQVATAVRGNPRNVVFTSGGTEAAALVLNPGFACGSATARRAVLIGAAEHACVLRGGRFPAQDVVTLPVTNEGLVCLDSLERALAQAPGAVVAVQHANNETGVIQPITEVAKRVKAAGGALVVDAVQSLGKVEVDIAALGADALFVSAHKLGGPKGVGAVVLADERMEIGQPLLTGGGQERSIRAGTENVAGIAGLGVAASLVAERLRQMARLRGLRDHLEQRLSAHIDGLVVFGQASPRLPNTSLVASARVRAETALIALDLAGIAASSGSACSSGRVQSSHVLAAMGVAPTLAAGAIRVSLGPENDETDIERFVEIYANLHKVPYRDERAARERVA